ncbi:helix-turn-helix transcriptional regulator [Kutzneria albida]|uniref:HTH luxR-type domain-containing protein n=1 Tax=Kutzneria albida DSM 43870 TaxID=1449976 RepID=W5WKB2_9PSEU|nr:helix-turn-helix transcriptional regulator [Kutzneria albida]AHI01017.1 hypothetical protein KALB_7659 [Kutzneria albida DSM 43870]
MLRGRHEEQRAVRALLDGARAGTSAALVLRGEPGIGKSALLEYAAEQARDMRVLRGTGVESEAELPFAGLHLLLRPVLDRVAALPAPQRRALSGAFGLGTGGGDRFMIGAGVLSLLAELAVREPLLCLVDDTQWLDRASAEALLFAARRLDREGVAILFAVREHAGALVSAGIPELCLTGLDERSAAELLADTGAVLPAGLREQLVAETGGNPLALRELPALVSAQGTHLGPLPLTSRVLDAFHHQVRGLPAATRTLLLIAAAEDTGDLPTLLRAAGELGVGAADLHPAEELGLMRLEGGTLVFRHPLIRAAVYQGEQLSQRIAVHGALAATHRDVDRRAWHLAAAATGPDESVAQDLEAAASRALLRQGHAAAAAGYERAAQLSTDTDSAIRRITLACEAGVHSGQLAWARARAERATREVTAPGVRSRLAEVRASADFVQGELARAYELFGESAATAEDPERAFWLRMRALHAVWAGGTDRRLIAEAVDRLDAPDGPLTAVAWLARWGTAEVLDRDTSEFPAVEGLLAEAAGEPRGMVEVASRAFTAARDEACAEIAAALVAGARTRGEVFALPAGLGLLTLAQVLLGEHREALVNGTEGMRIARDTDQPLWISYSAGALALLAAVQGDEPQCRRLAEQAGLDASATAGSRAGSTWAQAALVLLDLGHGRVQDAFDRALTVLNGPIRHQVAVVRCVPDLVEAAVRLGRAQDAAEPLALFARWARTLRQPWIDALLARCHALTTSDSEAEQHFLHALERHEPRSRPFERARTELVYGEWLRRSRRKNDARAHLNAALQVFEELGCTPWATRARTELGASGATVTQAARSHVFAELTPQELQISQLAAQGLSNRDIAAQLFLSPRTVAYHLYKAYPKLGISSRGELASLAR